MATQTRYRVEVVLKDSSYRPYTYYSTLDYALDAMKYGGEYGYSGFSYPDKQVVNGAVVWGEHVRTHWPPSSIDCFMLTEVEEELPDP